MGLKDVAAGIVRRLQEAGRVAYFAGGCVRDELLGRTPKDYDVATDATPEAVMALFPKTAPVGVQFGVVRVVTDAGDVEVATFRSDGPYRDGRHPETVVFTDAEHDASRRDFTVNAMFFDPVTGRLLDYCGGQDDLARKVIRAVGDPRARFEEDRLRVLRAVRFAAGLGFEMDAGTASAVREFAPRLAEVAWERI
ncbi:MAG: CCA tRNA nucleotidyltransferase, partial [bacterium]